MKGILGRKLGMTQVFDQESGRVTSVTVIEAGPCPVTQVRTAAADGYDAVQLAFEPVAERKITKGELGHLKKAGVEAHRHLAEFRGESGLAVGDGVERELHGVVAVGVRELHLHDRARAGLDHRDGGDPTGLRVEDLRHSQLFAEDALRHYAALPGKKLEKCGAGFSGAFLIA